MTISTKKSLIGKSFDAIGINKSFYEYKKIDYNIISKIIISVEAKIVKIVVGSLNVNKITVDYQEEKSYKKGTPCNYFSLGSSMLLCFQKPNQFLIKEGDLVKIGQGIVK